MTASVRERALYDSGLATVVYARVNPHRRSEVYVGQSTRPYTRDCEHLADGSLVLASRDHVRRGLVQRCDVAAGASGSVGAWIDVPLCVFPPDTITAAALSRAERVLIRTLGTLNSQSTPWMHTHRLLNRGSNRSRPVMAIRGCARAFNTGNPRFTITTYRLGGTDLMSPDLARILHHAQDQGVRKCVVHVVAGNTSLTNQTSLVRLYGETRICTICADGLPRTGQLKSLQAGIFTCVEGSGRVVRIRVLVSDICKADVLAARGGATELAKHLGAHPHAMAGLRAQLEFSQLEKLWAACRYVQSRLLRGSAEHVIDGECVRRVGFSMRYTPTVTFPASAAILTDTVRRAAKTLLKAIPLPSVASRLARRLRVVRSKAVTIAGAAHNWRKFDRGYDPGQPPECMCGKFPPSWRAATPNHLKVEGHFAILSPAYDGPGKVCMRVSCRTPVMHSAADLSGEATRAMKELVRGLPEVVQLLFKTSNCGLSLQACVMRAAGACSLADGGLLAGESRVSMGDLRDFRKFVQGAVLSEVDKGPGMTAILCPVAQWHVMRAAWPSEPSRCEVLSLSDRDVMLQDIRQYTERGWARLAKLYGCDDTNPVRACIPYVYATIKLKAFLQQKLKARPISPHTKIPLRWLYNIVATAHQYMLMCINTQRCARMFETSEYPRRLVGELRELVHEHGNLRVFELFGDLENMYTELEHTTINRATRLNVDRFLASDVFSSEIGHNLRARPAICVPRKGAKMATCHVGYAQDEEHCTVFLSDIIEVTEFANSRSIMRVGKELRKYTKGTPMGMQASCASANGVGLDAEFTADAQREASHGDSVRNLSLSYVDDCRVGIAWSESGAHGWTLESAREYARTIMDCYPAPLRMVCEPEGLATYRFLETVTLPSAAGGGSWCVHFNRPWLGQSYDMAAPAGRLFRPQQVNIAAANMIRAHSNVTRPELPLLALVIGMRCGTMLRGVGHSRAFVRDALARFGRHPQHRDFYRTWRGTIRYIAGL